MDSGITLKGFPDVNACLCLRLVHPHATACGNLSASVPKCGLRFSRPSLVELRQGWWRFGTSELMLDGLTAMLGGQKTGPRALYLSRCSTQVAPVAKSAQRI